MKKQREDELKKSAELKAKQQHLKQNLLSTEDEHRLISGLIILQATEVDPIMRIAGSVSTADGMGIGDLYQHIRTRNQTQKNVYR